MFSLWIAIASSEAIGLQLVSEASIEQERRLTKTSHLSNGIPVVMREIPGSDITHITISFSWGRKDWPKGHQILERWMWSTMPLGAKGYPKEKVFELTEKYGISLSCAGGIEVSWCSIEVVNDYWKTAMPLFSAIVNSPNFEKKEIDLQKARIQADLKSVFADPDKYSNDVINRIFYDEKHPYRLNHDEALKELEQLSGGELKEYHKKIVSSDRMTITLVSGLPREQILGAMETNFGRIKRTGAVEKKVTEPEFSRDKSFVFEHRPIPTAYIKIKFNAPSIKDPNYITSLLLFEILSEMLDEEIRTKRSLSYAVQAQTLQYSVGLGIISVSTSKPNETFDAIKEVIKKLRTTLLTGEDLEEYKRVFATGYYVGQETHSALANGISGYLRYFGSVEPLYEFPKRLEAVEPENVKQLAGEILKRFRIGVLFDREKFQEAWATSFIEETLQ